MKGRNQQKTGNCDPAKLHNQNCQSMKTNILITCIFLIQLLKKGMKIKLQIGLFFFAVKNLKFFLVMKGKTDPVYAHCVIRKWGIGSGNFGVTDVGIYDNQVIFCNGKGFVFNDKFSISLTDIKQFCESMGRGMLGQSCS